MPLTGKYLKYSPEITLEIFTLIWESFRRTKYDLGAGLNTIFNNWKRWNHIILDENSLCTTNNPSLIDKLSQTTVQEILGYDPFVKDDFVLPEKWFIKITDENKSFLNKWKSKQIYSSDLYKANFQVVEFNGNGTQYSGYTEITFDQFKKYVLKESVEEPRVESKEVIPEYVECIKRDNSIEIGKIYQIQIEKGFEYNNIEKVYFINNSPYYQSYFKPSTKKAFDAQNKPKPIEKWSVGSYVVFLEDNLQNNSRKIGDISKIKNTRTNAIDFEDSKGNNIDGEFSVVTNLKWFATKSEAEEFAKTLKPKKLLSLNNWYQSGNHIVYLYERNKVYGFHHDKWFTSEGFGENDLKYVDSSTVEEKFTNYIKNNYLIGKSFIDLVNKIDFQIKSYDLNFGNKTTQIYIPVEPNDLRGNKTARIFDKGIWAKCSSIESNKQAVHCTTQEEWNFVQEKIGYKFTIKFSSNFDTISLDDKCSGTKKSWYEEMKWNVLSFQEWCDLNGYKMENKHELEVEKWYKVTSGKIKLTNPNWYIKYKDCENNTIHSSEHINNNGTYINNHLGHFGRIGDYNFILIDISEIQQYLPNNHPDKIQKFKVGDWVTCTKEYPGYNGKIGKLYKLIEITENSLKFNQTNGLHPEIVGVRHATPEEINNHLISIGQIPAGNDDTPKLGLFEPSRFEKTNFKIGKTQSLPKILLSIDDEELPMVNIIKTNSIKQLLNND